MANTIPTMPSNIITARAMTQDMDVLFSSALIIPPTPMIGA